MNKDILELVKALSLKDSKSLSQKALKLTSECGEMATKALAYDNLSGDRSRFVSKEHILDEVADVILVALSMAYSLGYSEDDISSMMKDKAVHWSHLAEQDISDGKYPFEIHLTMLVKYLDGFVDWCNDLGDIKPIVLDLYHDGLTDIQVTTSSVVFGSLNDAIAKMKELVERTEKYGDRVIREKIETVPWHPAITDKNEMEGKYFESHIPIFLNNREELDSLRKYHGHYLHISKNTLKPDLDGVIKVFGTVRSPKLATLKHHEQNLKYVMDSLTEYNTGTIITEYAVLDSNEELDARWLGK